MSLSQNHFQFQIFLIYLQTIELFESLGFSADIERDSRENSHNSLFPWRKSWYLHEKSTKPGQLKFVPDGVPAL